MTQNISYIHCVCDICGKTEDIQSSLILPATWTKIDLHLNSYDCCYQCLKKINALVKSLKEPSELARKLSESKAMEEVMNDV